MSDSTQSPIPTIDSSTGAPETTRVGTFLPVPGYGMLAVNAFVIRGAEPVVVDTGVVALGDAYLEAIAQAVDLDDVRWIYLTHTDPDHIGCLRRLLELAPRARLVTTFLGMAKLGLSAPIAPERVFLMNPGQELQVGDRALRSVVLPSYDAPETTGVFDTRTRTLFSADCFGALVQAPIDSADALPDHALDSGMTTWAMVDAPWLPGVTDDAFRRGVEVLRSLQPSTVLSGHLPPSRSLERLLDALHHARRGTPFVGPDQAAVERMQIAS